MLSVGLSDQRCWQIVHVTARLSKLLAKRMKLNSSLVLETVDKLEELEVLVLLVNLGVLVTLTAAAVCC